MAKNDGPKVDTATITLTWETVYQKIDGFGAFAGRAVPFFKSDKRDTFMELLWGDTGLRLNIIRGEVLHTYPYDKASGVLTIKPAGVSIDVDPTSDAYNKGLTDDQKIHLAQLWILKKVRERHHVSMIIASAWTPPLSMKTNPKSQNAKFFNGLNFKTSSTDFAYYLAGFAKACQEEGIELYGISPSNEPENVLAPWPASFWAPVHLGEFISDNLRPALNAQKLNDVKIIASENAAWGTAGAYMSPYGGMDKSNVDIFAGHGYVEIGDLIFQKGLNQSPSRWDHGTGKNSVWMTEASDAGHDYDPTMAEGLRLAINMHEFLTECSVNAYVFWLGMLDYHHNEALLGTNDDKEKSISFPKTYDVMGQYSRYVRAGYYRFDSALAHNSTLKVSAYKDPATRNFSVVVVNPGAKEAQCRVNLSGFAAGSITPYLTSDSSDARWRQGAAVAPQADGSYMVTVPPSSVITFTGTANESSRL